MVSEGMDGAPGLNPLWKVPLEVTAGSLDESLIFAYFIIL